MEVEKAVILFYLGLAAAFCGAAGLVRGKNMITQSGFDIFALDLIRSATGVLGEYNLCR